MTGFRCNKSARLAEKRGPRARKRETENEIAFTFLPIDDGNYGGAPPTPAPVAMFE